MAHTHDVLDMDKHFIIDPISRKINPATPEKNKLMQHDHNSERFTFEINQMVEGHDMSLCDAIRIHYINLSDDKSSSNGGIYEVNDVSICGNTENEGDNKITFSWLVSRNATEWDGTIIFAITFSCTAQESVDYEWNTDVYSSIVVGKGLRNSEKIVEEYADVLQKWRNDLSIVRADTVNKIVQEVFSKVVDGEEVSY